MPKNAPKCGFIPILLHGPLHGHLTLVGIGIRSEGALRNMIVVIRVFTALRIVALWRENPCDASVVTPPAPSRA